VFSFGISLILSLIAVITKLLIDVGNGLGGPGNPVTLLWAGAAPIIALVVLHHIFTKVLKMPSPISPAGALAWGTAGGAAGAAIGSSLVNRAQNRAKGAAMQAARGGLHKATGGRLGAPMTRHGMGGGPKRGDIAGTVKGANAETVRAQTLSTQRKRAEALKKFKQQNPNALRQLGDRVKASAGRVLSAPKRGLLAADAYMSADAGTRAEIRAAARERLHAGLTEMRDHAQRAAQTVAQRVASAPYDTKNALDAASNAVYDGAGRAADATRRVAAELRQHPGQVAGAGTRAVWNGTKAAAKSRVTKTAVTSAAVVGAVALGPIGAVAASGYLVHKARAGMRTHKAKQEAIVAAYTKKEGGGGQGSPTATPTPAETGAGRYSTERNTEAERS
jgi:hypothetical protein